MESFDFPFKKVNSSTIFKPFDCGDSDLNEFLLEQSKDFQKELLAVTFILEAEDRILAFFSIFNDSIRVEDLEKESKTKKKNWLRKIVSNPKRFLKNFPALKIGRLAVCNKTQATGIGRLLVQCIIDIAIEQNKTSACKFITVDAYKQSLGFYEKLDFEYFTSTDLNDETRQMFLNLTPIFNSINEEDSSTSQEVLS